MLALAWLALLALLLLLPALLPGRCLLAGEYALHLEPWASELPDYAAQPTPGFNSLLWDSMAQYYPWRAFAHRSFAAGTVPLWNPHSLCGTPFLANFQSALFYPLNLPFWLFDPARVFGWMALFHLVLAGFGAYALARVLGLSRTAALTAGTAFELCGFLITWLELPTLVYVASWLPWALLFAYQAARLASWRLALVTGFILGIQALAGHPQIWLYSALAVGAVILFTRGSRSLPRLGFLALAFGLAGLLAAVQLLPAMELASASHRTSGATLERFAAYRSFALPPHNLVTAFLPDFFGRPSEANYWGLGNLASPSLVTGMYSEYCLFAGVAVLYLAVVGVFCSADKRARILGILALLLLLLALGTWLNAPLFFLIPGMASSGGPNRIAILYLLVMALLAAFGVDALRARHVTSRQLFWIKASVFFLGVLALAYTYVRVSPLVPDPLALWVETDAVGALRSLLALGFVSILANLVVKLKPRLAVLFPVLVGLELLLFAWGFNPTCDRAVVYPQSAFVEELRAAAGSNRIAVMKPAWPLHEHPRATLPPNAALAYGLYEIGGYDSLLLKDYIQGLEALAGRSPFPPTNGNMAFAVGTPGALARLGAACFVLPLPEQGKPVFLTDEAAAPTRAVAALGENRYAPVFNYPSPNRVDIELAQPATALLFSDTWEHGWRAWLVAEGQAESLELLSDSLARRQISLASPAKGVVRMAYRPPSFLFGLYCTLIALFMAAFSLGGTLRRSLYGRTSS